jgi:hypothetical protein
MLNGSPRGWPKGHLRNNVLGGLIFSERRRTIEIPIVVIPVRSISLWISPTD